MTLMPRGLRRLVVLSMFTLILALDRTPSVGFADGPTPALAPFPAAVLRRLEQAPQYLELKALFDKQRRQEESAAAPSARSRRLQAALTRLRAEAASTTTIDPENPEGARVANYTRSDGRIMRFTSMVPSAIESNEAVRNDAAGMLARFIIKDAADGGLIPFDPPLPLREAAAREMSLGYAAAKQKDYAEALLHFEKARASTPNAPEIYYNLGLAEARIPGRELRAVVWLGAYLASDPGAPNAPAIRKQIADLETVGVTRFITITEEIANEIPGDDVRPFYLIDLVSLWASIGNYSAAVETLKKIQGAYNADSAIEKIVLGHVKRNDFKGALAMADTIRDLGVKGAALRSVAEAQAIGADVENAVRTVDGIEDLFCKSTGYQWLARVRIAEGDTAGALEMLAIALQAAGRVPDPYFKDLAKQYIAVSQAQAGDAAAALRTIAGMVDPFQVSIATLYTAEWQAHAGDPAGARQTLAAGLRSIDSVKPDSRSIAQGAYREVKERIDAGAAGKRDEPPPAQRAPFVASSDWVGKNEGLLSDQIFRDLNGHLKTVAADNPGKIFRALEETAKKMIAAHDEIWAMLDEQERINPHGSASGSASAAGEESAEATPDPAVSGSGPNMAEGREYSYQGRRITLHPDQVFDITGRVEKAEITVAGFDAGSEYEVTLVLNEDAKQAFNDFTEKNVGKETGLVHQTRLVMVAVVHSPISAGVVRISGGYRTVKEAQKAAAEFKAE